MENIVAKGNLTFDVEYRTVRMSSVSKKIFWILLSFTIPIFLFIVPFLKKSALSIEYKALFFKNVEIPSLLAAIGIVSFLIVIIYSNFVGQFKSKAHFSFDGIGLTCNLEQHDNFFPWDSIDLFHIDSKEWHIETSEITFQIRFYNQDDRLLAMSLLRRKVNLGELKNFVED